ncbi:MAG: hypothetical protein WC382_02695 [Methanoregulaceae archaeon]|jgi:hypothetical protein
MRTRPSCPRVFFSTRTGWLRAREIPAGIALVALSFSVGGIPAARGTGVKMRSGALLSPWTSGYADTPDPGPAPPRWSAKGNTGIRAVSGKHRAER